MGPRCSVNPLIKYFLGIVSNLLLKFYLTKSNQKGIKTLNAYMEPDKTQGLQGPKRQGAIAKMIDIKNIAAHQPLRIIIGAGDQQWPGWIATQKEQLDLLCKPENWRAIVFHARPADAFLCEHVWEHLTETEGRAAALCFKWLKPGGYLRCAVPDGNFPDPDYQMTGQDRRARPGRIIRRRAIAYAMIINCFQIFSPTLDLTWTCSNTAMKTDDFIIINGLLDDGPDLSVPFPGSPERERRHPLDFPDP
jgi:predicted SAM-dependent methyltransferase